MTKYEKRRLKKNIYKHGNGILYVVIFLLATVITITAAVNRSGKISYVDESRLAAAETESIAIKNSKTNKVAVKESNTETVTIEENTTEVATEQTTTEQTTTKAKDDFTGEKVKIVTDTLYIRNTPDAKGEVVGMAEMDETYNVISQNGEWIKINYNGNEGYVNSKFVKIQK